MKYLSTIEESQSCYWDSFFVHHLQVTNLPQNCHQLVNKLEHKKS